MIVLLRDDRLQMDDHFKLFWALIGLRYRIKLRIRMNLRLRMNLLPKHYRIPCLIGLFRRLFVRWENMMKMMKIKMNWPLLDLSALPQVKIVVHPGVDSGVTTPTYMD